MDLYIDVGNTTIKYGYFKDDELILLHTKNTQLFVDEVCTLDINEQLEDITRVVISSVVPKATEKLTSLFTSLNKEVVLISSKDDAGIKIEIDDINELGTDLLCDLASGYQLFHSPLLIVDLGTVTKFLFIDKNGTFSTCSFVPGLELTLKTLSKNTALLPKIEVSNIKPLLDNHNTKDVIMSSTYYSHIDTLNGMVKGYQNEVGYPFKVVITGGNIELVHSDKEIEFEFMEVKELCLRGIKVIMDRK